MSGELIIKSGAALLSTILMVLVLAAVWTSWREGERRAAFRLAGPGGLVVLLGWVSLFLGAWTAGLFSGLVVLGILVLTFPLNGKSSVRQEPRSRIDERDIMFARRDLVPGSDRFESYYRDHPEKRALDDTFRAKPGLLQPGSLFYDPCRFASAEASFAAVSSLYSLVDGPVSGHPVSGDPVSLSTYLKHWAKTLGAVSAGITRLREVHLYSHLGRHEPYGEPVRKEHDYAIALTVEMDKQMLDHAPYAPTVMESARQYFNSAAIAVQLASWIRAQGYPARAHIDGDYRVVCPLVARDAGLGEIGRMGVLMTPELGPRVRLAVVTTNLPLKIDSPSAKASMIDFCRRCEKCARVCPAQAIPYGDRRQLEGAWRWQIDSEACFTYWCTAGTDCGRCVRVCPYSHPSNWMHDIIRAGIRRSSLLRALAVKADDGLYGKQPAPKKFK